MPSPFLLWVNSRPLKPDDDTWVRWYTTEHLPDLVSSRASSRAAFWQEVGFPKGKEADSERKYLALYQSEFQEPLKSKEYEGIRKTSDLFKTGSKVIHENGEFDARNYGLVQAYDPKKEGEGLHLPLKVTISDCMLTYLS